MTREEKMKQILSEFIPLYKGKSQYTISVSNVARTAFIKGWEAADAHPISPWISVEDRLPKVRNIKKGYIGEIVFIHTRFNLYDAVMLHSDGLWRSINDYEVSYEKTDVTHWMPVQLIKKEGAE